MDDDQPILLALILIALVLSVLAIVTFVRTLDEFEQGTYIPELAVVYDSPSSMLREVEAECSECGQIAAGMNGEIVCRNEECSLYGVAVKVS